MSKGSSLNLQYCQQLLEERFERRLQEGEHARMVSAADTHLGEGPPSAMARLKALLAVIRTATVRSLASLPR